MDNSFNLCERVWCSQRQSNRNEHASCLVHALSIEVRAPYYCRLHLHPFVCGATCLYKIGYDTLLWQVSLPEENSGRYCVNASSQDLLSFKRKRRQDVWTIRVVLIHFSSVDARASDTSVKSMEQFDEWGKEEGKARDVLWHILSFTDVVTLVEKKQVSKAWNTHCTKAIDNKCANQKKIQTKHELLDVVKIYCRGKPEDMEELATKYRFPIGKFDVSELENFSYIFAWEEKFNEDISSWNVSKAKTMEGMFGGASAFNKPLNGWDTSKVENLQGMFSKACSFNQPLDNWDTHEVRSTAFMFYGATSFNQPLDSWILSNVREMSWMFEGARSFNQSLQSWDVRYVHHMKGMFLCATSFNPANLAPYMDPSVVL